MKIKIIFKVLLTFLMLGSHPSLQASFFEARSEGWHWYQDPLIEEPQKEDLKSLNNVLQTQPMTPTQLIKAYQKELEQKLHRAFVYPSLKNIKAYQTMQKDFMQRSQYFSEVWMRAVYQNPHLDHTLVSPVNQKARHLYLDQQHQFMAQTIAHLKKDYGLFFFFSSQCAYCHQFSPIVKRFSDDYGWKVLAISTDGGTIEGFSEVLPDNGLVEKWKVDVLPALFAVNPKTGHVLPVAYGLSSIDQMELRIMSLASDLNQGAP